MFKSQTTIQLLEFDTLYLFAIAAFLGVAVSISLHHFPQKQITSLPVAQNFQNLLISLDPSPTQHITQVSPDGSMILTMVSTTNNDLSHSYIFQTVNGEDNSKHTIYTVTLPPTDSMVIPFNTWSPDNTYVFLEHHRKDGVTILVFRADGQNILEGEKYINVTDVFAQYQMQNAYDQTTGWASGTLLIVDTKEADNSKGPSYWVEIPSKAVIPLATQF